MERVCACCLKTYMVSVKQRPKYYICPACAELKTSGKRVVRAQSRLMSGLFRLDGRHAGYYLF
ncbi:MAG: hypothetical protein LBH66_08990 [Oscillospiraceae bacterium]|nr:hypothetical protein [Oscillospiraceae bacterium]